VVCLLQTHYLPLLGIVPTWSKPISKIALENIVCASISKEEKDGGVTGENFDSYELPPAAEIATFLYPNVDQMVRSDLHLQQLITPVCEDYCAYCLHHGAT